MSEPETYTAFAGAKRVASGGLKVMLTAVKDHVDRLGDHGVLIFEDRTGRQVDFNLTGTLEQVLRRAEPQVRNGPGRPKLGVVSREVSLLPRQWEWLEEQPHGISATLRRLVDDARKHQPNEQRKARAREAASRFMTAMAGNRPNFEEASRALFAQDYAQFQRLVRRWPKDICGHIERLLDGTTVPDANAGG
ncbi:MAG: DUF2239 family protein [Deltaproteobacteria bacterium]|nr:DUF2239 family protein [Deltaproteobacteria bacterium]